MKEEDSPRSLSFDKKKKKTNEKLEKPNKQSNKQTNKKTKMEEWNFSFKIVHRGSYMVKELLALSRRRTQIQGKRNIRADRALIQEVPI